MREYVLAKENDDLVSDLKRIANIAHAGGLCGLDAFGAILAIRRLTVDYFYIGRTEENMRSDVQDAIVEASPFFSRQSSKS